MSELNEEEYSGVLREAVEKALIQISGGLCYTTAEAKHAQLRDAEKTLQAALAHSPQPEPVAEEGREPCPDLNSLKHDEAWAWISANCMALRRDNGDMDYSFGAMIKAYEAGKASAQPPAEVQQPVAVITQGPCEHDYSGAMNTVGRMLCTSCSHSRPMTKEEEAQWIK